MSIRIRNYLSNSSQHLVWSPSFLCYIRRDDETNGQLLGHCQRPTMSALHINSLGWFVRNPFCLVQLWFFLIVFVVVSVDGGVAVGNVDLMLLRYLDRVIFPLPDDYRLSRCDVLWPYYWRRLSLVHQLQQHMTHYVIDVTPAHVCVIDYVHLCAVHRVRRVPLDLLMDSTLISIHERNERVEHYSDMKSCEKKKR